MSVMRLADVELCLIAHNLQCCELVRFARTSNKILHALSSAFAWRFVHPPVIVCCSDPSANHWTNRLARFFRIGTAAPTTILPSKLLASGVKSSRTVRFIEPAGRDPIRDEHLEQLSVATAAIGSQVGGIHCFDASQCGLRFKPDALTRVLYSDPMKQLVDLRLFSAHHPGRLDDHAVLALVRLPALEVLHVFALQWKSDLWSPLPRAPRLKTLVFRDAGINRESSPLRHIACCNLTQLTLVRPCLYPRPEDFFSSQRINHLQSLKLDEWNASAEGLPKHVQPMSPQCAPGLFARMQWLREFHLKRVCGIDGLLPAISYMARLKQLIIEPAVRGEPAVASAFPTAPVLRALLQRCEMLVVTVWLLPAHVERHLHSSDESGRVIAAIRHELLVLSAAAHLGGVLKIQDDGEPEP